MKPSINKTIAEQLQTDRFYRRVEIVNKLNELLNKKVSRQEIEEYLRSVRLIATSGIDIPLGLDGMETWEDERFYAEVGNFIISLREDNESMDKEALEGVRQAIDAVCKDIDATDVPFNVTKRGAASQAPSILHLQPNIKRLQEVADTRWIDYDQMQAAYKALNAELPKDELAEAKRQFEKILLGNNFDGFVAASKKIHELTEGDKRPIIMPPRPQYLIVDGQKVGNSIATMQEIMRKAANADNNLKPLEVSDYVPGKIPEDLKPGMEDIYNKVWDRVLTVWTSACIKGSKDKNYQAQLKHQVDILGVQYGIEADMILAMALRYISGKEELMRQDFMRLNTRGTDGDPLGVRSYDGDLGLGSSRRDARSGGGLGASFRISS